MENHLSQSQQLFNVTICSKALAFATASFGLVPIVKACDSKGSWTMDIAAPAMSPAVWAISSIYGFMEA